jgi:large subunit ribosomal protein L40
MGKAMGTGIGMLRLGRMHQSMHSACEELRNFDPPGQKDAGRLYRIAMEKKGIFKHGGVPIEYARAQTETPAREAWNHGWTR